MEIICLETEAFYSLVETVVFRIREKDNSRSRWIQSKAAMDLLGIKSKTTLQKLRAEGKIRYSQPFKKVILYDQKSLIQYLESHANQLM